MSLRDLLKSLDHSISDLTVCSSDTSVQDLAQRVADSLNSISWILSEIVDEIEQLKKLGDD